MTHLVNFGFNFRVNGRKGYEVFVTNLWDSIHNQTPTEKKTVMGSHNIMKFLSYCLPVFV